MKFANLLSKFYCEPWCIRPDKHAAMGRLLQDYLKSPRGFMSDPGAEPAESCEMEVHSGIAWIPIHGVLGKHLSQLEMMCGGCDYDQVAEMVEEATADPAVHTLLLDFSSPGGITTGLPELAARLRTAAQSKQLIAWSETECCSAAYWLASQCHEIYCTPSASIGCVGTYIAGIDDTRAWEMEGHKLELFRSGKLKALGMEGKAWSDEDRAFLQARVDKNGVEFRAAILANRPGIPADALEGQWFDGTDAVSNGLADATAMQFQDVIVAILANQPI
ncbi:MAG: S49 family peptidase [Verrucomicrobiae bacterium]